MKRSNTGIGRVPDLLRARDLLTVAVFFASLLVTFEFWKDATQYSRHTVQGAFDERVRDVTGRITARLQVYEQVLHATRGLFAVNDAVTRDMFRTFVDYLNLPASYPGIQGMGFAILVSPDSKTQHESQVREEGFPDYTIRPEGARNQYSSVVYLEPFVGRNLRAFGYDMYAEPTRRAAMERARDTGAAALSGKVTLVQEAASEVQPGFLMYLPIYRRGAPAETLEERRSNLVGWVFAPFRMQDFMRGILGGQAGDIDLEIYDATQLSPEARMYDTVEAERAFATGRRLRHVSRIDIGQHTWTVAIAALPPFEQGIGSDRPLLIVQAGIAISLLLALLMWIFLDDRARALLAAEQAMQLALYDPLTGLPNRKLLDERLQQAISNARRRKARIGLLFIDLDKFKPVNDTYGHSYGDLLLKEVANRLRSCMRESDTASRLGGDEFVVLLPNIVSDADVALVAEKILDQLTQPYPIAGHTFDISASIGAAVHPEDGHDAKSLTRSADLAMYEAKNSGRANVKFAPRLDEARMGA